MSIADKTVADLAVAVLVKLNVVRQGVTPSALRVTTVSNCYLNKFLELEDRGLGYWVPEAIPALVFQSLVKIIACEVAPEFGFAASDPDNMMLGKEGLDALIKMQVKKSANEPVQGEYL